MLECATNKSLLWNQKRCPILVVRKSSFEVDRRVPGNRDEFPFSQAEWSSFLAKSSLMRENLTSQYIVIYETKVWKT